MKNFGELQTACPLPEGTVLLQGDPAVRSSRALDALEKGFSVVWPTEAATTPEILKRLAAKYGGKILPFAPLLSSPRTIGLTHAVRAGEAGEIGTATHRRTRASGAFAPWASDASALLLNDLAILRRLFGRPSHAFATCAAAEGMAFYTICLALPNGVLGNVVCQVAKGLEVRFAFDYAGRKGNLVHEGREGLEVLGASGEEDVLGLDEAEGVKTAWTRLSACFRGEMAPAYAVDEWITDLRTLRAAEASARDFRPEEVA